MHFEFETIQMENYAFLCSAQYYYEENYIHVQIYLIDIYSLI